MVKPLMQQEVKGKESKAYNVHISSNNFKSVTGFGNIFRSVLTYIHFPK